MADLRWANNKTTKMFTFIHSCLEREDIIVEAYLQAGFNRVRSLFQSLAFELWKSSKIGLSRQKHVTCLSRPIVFQVKKNRWLHKYSWHSLAVSTNWQQFSKSCHKFTTFLHVLWQHYGEKLSGFYDACGNFFLELLKIERKLKYWWLFVAPFPVMD